MNALKMVLLRAIWAALWVPTAVFWRAASWHARLGTRVEVLRQWRGDR